MKRLLISAALLALTGLAAVAAPLVVPDTIAQRVQACVVCHGQQDRITPSGYFPRIAGKPAGYLYNQLQNFRDGRRNYPAMTSLVEHLTDDYLREIAQYFSGLDLPYPPPQTVGASPDLLARGEALVMKGDASRKIPACVQCHGQAMLGMQPAIPGLVGLPRDYLNAQLGAWQTGQRRARAPDCMAQIAKQLTAQDVGAVSTWLSSRQVPAHSAPAKAATTDLPLECGSGLK
jgi:cytochrome c553